MKSCFIRRNKLTNIDDFYARFRISYEVKLTCCKYVYSSLRSYTMPYSWYHYSLFVTAHRDWFTHLLVTICVLEVSLYKPHKVMNRAYLFRCLQTLSLCLYTYYSFFFYTTLSARQAQSSDCKRWRRIVIKLWDGNIN